MSKYVAYVHNPAVDADEPIVLLGVASKVYDAVLACATEADTEGHEDAAWLAHQATNRITGYTTVHDDRVWNWAPETPPDLLYFENGDGVVYYVKKVHDIDEGWS
jgi:hypothetical protein